MYGLGGHYAKWKIRQRNSSTVWYLLYVESKKYKETISEYNKKEIFTGIETRLVVTCEEGESRRGNVGVGD